MLKRTLVILWSIMALALAACDRRRPQRPQQRQVHLQQRVRPRPHQLARNFD